MKVGDGNSNAPSHDDLIERMERAHRQEAASGVDDATAAAGSAPAEAAGGSVEAGDAPKPSKLESKLVDAAARALAGEFDSADELREEIIDVIVDQRYAGKLPDDQADQIRDTVRATLAGDPIFRQEVDNMLVLAAEELGRADK